MVARKQPGRTRTTSATTSRELSSLARVVLTLVKVTAKRHTMVNSLAFITVLSRALVGRCSQGTVRFVGRIFKLFVFSTKTQHLGAVSKVKKTERIAAMAAQFAAEGVDARYAGYFVLFNEQKFYEAHDILEDLWLPDRKGKNGNFYKGLIQLAGAFVHLQKNRLRPSAALFKLADANLEKYPAVHEQLDVLKARGLIRDWLQRLEGG